MRADRLRRLAPALIAIGLAGAGVALNLLRPAAPPLPDVVTELDDFPAALLADVAAYRGPRVVAAIVVMLVEVLVPLLVVALPWGRRTVARLAGPQDIAPRPAMGHAFVIGGGIWAVTQLATLPVRAWVGLHHDRAFGIRTGPASGWWRDTAVALTLEVLVAGALAALLIGLAHRFPRTWHWHGTVAATLTAAVVLLVWPIVVAPLLRPERPLPSGPVRDEVVAVLDAAGLADTRVVLAAEQDQTRLLNAQVAGIGPSRTVVLWDTLLALPPEQVGLVVAHELAHREHRDLERGVLGAAAGALPLLLVMRWVAGRVADEDRGGRGIHPRLVAVGVVVVVTFRLVADPIALWQSRQVEAAADHRALELTQDPASSISLQRTFVEQNLSTVERPLWQTVLFATHPAAGERIRAAVVFARDRGLADQRSLGTG